MRSYIALEREIDQLEEEKVQLWARLQAPHNSDAMPHGSGISDQVANAAVKLAELNRLIGSKIDTAIDLRMEIERAIEGLPADDRVLMRMRYIQGLRWEDIAYKMHYCSVWVQKKHGNILIKIANL